jgi:transposase
LKRLVLEQQARLESRDAEIEQLRLMLAKLRRLKFGRSSEVLDTQISQLELALEELETKRSTLSVRSTSFIEPQKPVRRALPESLPREEIVHAAPVAQDCTCSECGGALREMGEDSSEVLEYVPSRFKVIRHVRPKFSCSHCQKIVQAPATSRPIERGLAGPALLAHVLVSKYCDHLPLYRQSQIYAREGVELDRSTLADWVGGASRLLNPLIDALEAHVMQAKKLHADDTPIPVLSPGNGKTKTARLWVYVRDDRPAGSTEPAAVLFRYTPDRKAIHPSEHLKDFEGVLQADGYAGFDALYERTPKPLLEAACWAHVRRKFLRFTWLTTHRSHAKRSSGSAPCTRSKSKFADARQTSASQYA